MDANRTPLLAANWKMNQSWADCEQFIDRLKELCPAYFKDEEPPLDLLICPSFVYLGMVGSLLDEAPLFIGAQDVSRFEEGAYTGDVSAQMLSQIGCDFAIVGHSERRNIFGEEDAGIAQKLALLRQNEVVPILCVGEALEEREAGRASQFTLGQLAAVDEQIAEFEPGELVIAYEPVWAIGTGKSANQEDAQAMAASIRSWLVTQISSDFAAESLILYGGSVKPSNIAAYLNQTDVDGALIGGASLQAGSYAEMVVECEKLLKNS